MAIDPSIVAIACATVATVFVGSAAMKSADLDEFRAAVENYRIVPEWIAGPIARMVPILETAGAVGLIFTATRTHAAMLLLSLIAIFTGAIAFNLARGRRDIDCGCFGPMMRQRLSGWLIVRNGVLALIVAIAIGPEDARALGALDFATIIPAAAALVMLYAAANYLLANQPAIEALRDA
ncbi:MAG: MauE/DoxX family redox-associated membrane protein [Candidatus Binataceae bacterium]